MKRILTTVIAFALSLCVNAQNYDVIDPDLQKILNQKSNDKISINIVLSSQADNADLNVKFDDIKDKTLKRENVIKELKAFSAANQNKVMAFLQAEAGNDNVADLKAHWLVNTINCTATKNVIYELSEQPGVSVIGYNEKVKLISDEKPQPAQKSRGLIDNITTVGADQVWAEGYTGKDVIVAVLDSGVNSEHVDLADHLWDGGYEYPDHGWNFIDNNSNTNDNHGHGTHCAGTICGDGTSGTQTGMAPDATLMCVKVLNDEGEGTLEALVSGVEFAIENSADILSLSLGWTFPNAYVSTVMREMFENVLATGVVASVAAGNERGGIDTIPIPRNITAPGNCPPPYLHPDQQANPGGLSAVVSVGAVDYYDEVAYFSSQGPVTWQNTDWNDYLYDDEINVEDGWLYYDNDLYSTNIGGPDSFYWGVMFPADILEQHGGTSLTKIAIYDVAKASTQILIYYGGNYAPETLVYVQDCELIGSNSMREIELDVALPINGSENLWVVMYTEDGASYPASSSDNTGDPNGRWLSLDGTTWEDLINYELYNTWMLRAYVTDDNTNAVAELKSITDYEYKAASKGTLAALESRTSQMSAAANENHFGLIRPDVSAPGVEIVSSAYNDNYGFLTMSGTSMATPCVAGVMALMLDKEPNLSPADICKILETTATKLESTKSNLTGSGRINAYLAINEIDNIKEETPTTPTTPSYRNVLIEEFTGRLCGYCPDGHRVANEIAAANPGRVFTVNYHTQNGLSPTSYPNLNVSESTILWNAFNVSGIPTGNINRNSSEAIGRYEWEGVTNTQLSQSAEVNISGKVNIDEVTRTATITVETYYTSSSNSSTNYLTIMMLQDSIFGSQSGATSNPSQVVNGEYCHMHVLRDVITDTWGDAIAPTTAGTLITKQYVYEIPEVIGYPNGVEVDLDNIYFLAFVTEKKDGTPTRPVLNVNKLEPSKVPDNPDDDNTATAPSMRLTSLYANDGLEYYDYIYPNENSTNVTCVNKYDFISNTENIDSLFYDERGNITKLARWTKIDGQWFYADYVDYTYNDKNLRTSRANYNNWGDVFELGGVYNYKYDDEGRMIEWSLKFIIDEFQKAIIEYDEEGRKISETIQQYNFSTYYLENYSMTEYEYDNKGNITEEFTYLWNDMSWSTSGIKYYEYDEFDNCILMENRTANGTVQERRIYTYDLSILAENVFYYPNPEEDFPQLPEAKTHLLKSFEYFAQNDKGEFVYVVDYIMEYMEYEEISSNNHWNPDESLYANNMTIITTVEIDGEEQYNPNLELGAFCNGELRGSARLQYVDSPANRYEAFLMVYGNSGDDITFRLYDHGTGLESDFKSSEVVDFEVNATIGDVVNPYIINFKGSVLHSRALNSGWNWYSTYVINEGAEGLANLEAALGSNGIQIKNQTKFVNQASGNWYGTLTSTAVEDMFMIQMANAHTLELEGYVVNPADYPITLGTNWKWISYPLASEMSVNEAFANANPSNGDYVKSQKGFAQYYDGLGWSGTLQTMTPGMGYMYQNTSGYAKTLVYPMANAKSKAEAEVEENLHWTANATKYPMNMTVIAVVEDATRDYEVAAFSNGECRGSARPIYIEALGQSMIFMTIYGDDNDNVSFRYYDVTTGEEVALNEVMTFEFNATHGDIMQPYVMTLSTMGIDETSAGFSIYPNPVQDKLYIEAEAEIEEVVVYDVYGRVQNLRNSETQKLRNSIDVSNLNSGVYFVKIKTEEGNITKRFVKE